ncbi:MAG: hypothetical protein ABIY37_07835 [Devosia sp.]
MTNATLAGRAIDVDLGPFVPRLTFLADSRMRLQAQIGPNTVDEIVAVDIKSIRPDVFLVAWSESSSNYVVQLQDYQNGVVHNRARLADGQLFEVEATMRTV